MAAAAPIKPSRRKRLIDPANVYQTHDGRLIIPGKLHLVRPYSLVQECLTWAEYGTYNAMWNAVPGGREDPFRVLQISHSRLAGKVGKSKPNNFRIIKSLKCKLAIDIIPQEASSDGAAAGRENTVSGTLTNTYRVWSMRQILQRLASAEFHWIFKTGTLVCLVREVRTT